MFLCLLEFAPESSDNLNPVTYTKRKIIRIISYNITVLILYIFVSIPNLTIEYYDRYRQRRKCRSRMGHGICAPHAEHDELSS